MAHRPTHDARPITADGFARLLRRLAEDPDRAAIEYERLRLTLVKFFDWRGAWPPEECADETLDRLTEKLALDAPIQDVWRYAQGIARLVLLEHLRRQAQEAREPIDRRMEVSTRLSSTRAETADPLHDCFERCLGGLPPENRTLVLQYYVGEGQTKIDHRRNLARSLGLSDGALRSRVQRLRDRLERCVESCMAAADAVGLEAALRHVSADTSTLEVKISDEDRSRRN